MDQETTIVKIYNEKYNKYWTCTLKSYKSTWCNNGWQIVTILENYKPVYKDHPKPDYGKVTKPWFKRLFSKIFSKK